MTPDAGSARRLVRRLAPGVICWLAFTGACSAHGDLEERIAGLSARLADSPHDAGLLVALGDIQRQHEDWVEALASYAAARRLGDSGLELDFREGRVWLEAGAAERAVPLLDRHLSLHPDDARALLVRARAQGALHQWLQAAASYARAQRLLQEPAPDIYLEHTRALLAAGPEYQSAAFMNLAAGVERLGPLVSLIRCGVNAARERQLHSDVLHWLDRLPDAMKQQPVWLAERAQALLALGRGADAARLHRQTMARIQALPDTRRYVPAMQALEQQVNRQLNEMGAPDPGGRQDSGSGI